MTEKKKEIMLPTATEEKPVRNFLILIALIPVSPFIMIYSIVTGKLQNPFIVGACLTMILGAGGYYLYDRFTEYTPTKQEKVLQLFEELNEKEKKELMKKTSTLRKSIDVEKLPKQLTPIFDVEQDLLSINYYYFLLQTGYMGENAEGSVYVLQNALRSSSKNLAKAAWEALSLINTKEAQEIKDTYAKEVEEASKQKQQVTKEQTFNKKYYYKDPTWSQSIRNDLLKLKDKFK